MCLKPGEIKWIKYDEIAHILYCILQIQEKRNCAPGIRTNPQEEVIVDTMVSMPMLISAPSASSSVPITYLQGSMEIPVALKYIHYSQ